MRWYDKDGTSVIRISVHAPDGEILAVHHPVTDDVQRSPLSAAADLSSQLAARCTRRHLSAVPDLPGDIG